MEITTKFNVGDTAYYLDNKRIIECIVKEIKCTVNKSTIESKIANCVAYTVCYTDCELLTDTVNATDLYASPEELCSCLMATIWSFDRDYLTEI